MKLIFDRIIRPPRHLIRNLSPLVAVLLVELEDGALLVDTNGVLI
jgi:hypothetical protein